jgi:hypothetical protein
VLQDYFYRHWICIENANQSLLSVTTNKPPPSTYAYSLAYRFSHLRCSTPIVLWLLKFLYLYCLHLHLNNILEQVLGGLFDFLALCQRICQFQVKNLYCTLTLYKYLCSFHHESNFLKPLLFVVDTICYY